MKVLVTGGAGFIGSNFVLYLLESHPECRIVNVDKLTYAGNLENLAGLEGDSRHRFVKLDICQREPVEELLLAEKHSGAGRFCPDQCSGYAVPARGEP